MSRVLAILERFLVILERETDYEEEDDPDPAAEKDESQDKDKIVAIGGKNK